MDYSHRAKSLGAWRLVTVAIVSLLLTLPTAVEAQVPPGGTEAAAAALAATKVTACAAAFAASYAANPLGPPACQPTVDGPNLASNIASAVYNASDSTREYFLDGLAWEVANLAIESLTKSTVNWINSGFQGSPAFVTDLNKNLQGVGDVVARRFFSELASEASAIKRTPFQDKVLDAVRLGYYLRTSPESFYTRNPYTLDQVSSNDRAFLEGDFSQGGFNAWFAATMNPNNNRYGAEILANQALENAVSGASGTRLQELSWNRGFLQWCGDAISPRADAAEAVSLQTEDQCVGKATRTPGTVIQEQLNEATKGGLARLTVADDFNEIIGALLNQLAMQVLGGGEGGGGLTGASRPSAGGGKSFLDRTTDPSQRGGSDIGVSFSGTIDRQVVQMERFEANWEKIRTAAQKALAVCKVSNNERHQKTLDRATLGVTKATEVLVVLRAIQKDIRTANTAGGDQAGLLTSVSSAYSKLINSGSLPTVEEISEAETESQDTGSLEPGSLYSQMTRLSTSLTCNVSGE